MKKKCFQIMKNNVFICVGGSSEESFGGVLAEKLVI
jgi:hypothetical protein